MKTSEEYLAEYVREKRPEIEESIDYVFWKLGRQMGDIVHDVCKMVNGLTLDERKQMLLKTVNDENLEVNDDDMGRTDHDTKGTSNKMP